MWIDDQILRRSDESLALSCWIPSSPLVVLGSSNQATLEVDEERCARDDVPVLKRYGGGGTVLLYDGCIVVSCGAWVRQHFQNGFYFQSLNQAVIDCLAEQWPACAALTQRGLSDIALADKKLAGTSLFRSRNYLLYQASLLVEIDSEKISRYLKHPSREPEYRGGRTHRDFLLGVSDLEATASPEACRQLFETRLVHHLQRTLGDELVAPFDDQIPGLLRRVAAHA